MQTVPFLFSIFWVISSIYASGDAVNYDVYGYTALHRLCLSGQFEAASRSISTDSPLINLPDKATKALPLHILIEKAASNPQSADKIVEMIEMLITKGSSLTAQTDSGWTPLNKAVYLAADFPDYPLKIIDLLLEKQPNSCDAAKLTTRQQTAMHFAAASRLPGNRAKEIVEKLIKACDKSFDYAALNRQSWTALKVATAAGNFDVVNLLTDRTPAATNYWIYGIVAVLAVVVIVVGLVSYFVFYRKKKAEENSKEEGDEEKEELVEGKEEEEEEEEETAQENGTEEDAEIAESSLISNEIGNFEISKKDD